MNHGSDTYLWSSSPTTRIIAVSKWLHLRHFMGGSAALLFGMTQPSGS
ncbi:hypothetical protein LINGRAHAP2_LOCUS8159 [Linum grandiflorum]